MKKILENQSIIWLIFLGISLIIFGIYTFLEIRTIEEEGGVFRTKKILQLIYNFGGKYTLLALFESIGIICVISGIKQLNK